MKGRWGGECISVGIMNECGTKFTPLWSILITPDTHIGPNIQDVALRIARTHSHTPMHIIPPSKEKGISPAHAPSHSSSRSDGNMPNTNACVGFSMVLCCVVLWLVDG